MYNVYPLFKTNRSLRVCEPTSDDGYAWQIVPLDEAEKARLLELEAIVNRGLQTFYEVGQALIEIRDRKLYRQTHKTFEAYCKEKWKISKPAAYRLLKAAEVMKNLSPIGDKILREENRQLKAELRQRDKDWEIRLAVEREKIRAEIEAKYRN
jgi:hypothetical protein